TIVSYDIHIMSTPPHMFCSYFFYLAARATSEFYTLSLHDALPISAKTSCVRAVHGRRSVDPRSRRGLPRRLRPQAAARRRWSKRSEEHTSELQSLRHLVCRLLLEKKKYTQIAR